MKFSDAQQYLLSKPEATEDFPFGPDVNVYRVKNKMFATLAPARDSEHYWMNLKCDPQEAIMLRDIFDAVIPGYHMNKQNWNTIILDGSVPRGEIERMIDNSYALIVKSLKKVDRMQLELHYTNVELYGKNRN